jgi:hypothetical protein
MKSVMKKNFGEVPNVDIPRSTFDRSHGYKTTFDASKLIPFFVDEIYPGDTMKYNLHGFARLSTPIYPIMDNMFLETFFFFVPNRLVFEKWPNLMGERKPNPDSSIDYTIPVIDDLVNADNESLWDYLGLPTKVGAAYEFNALIPRGYNLIYNEWFRDQNLQESVAQNTDVGPDTYADYELLNRGKRPDYFTSALPWLQKGDSVLLALGETAPVVTDDSSPIMKSTSGTDFSDGTMVFNSATAERISVGTRGSGSTGPISFGTNTGLETDLSSAVGPSVNELRQAVQIQRLLEKDARSGTRYVELVKSHFGVTSPDFRVQRPEYLGGGRTPVNITPIARTDSSPGQLGAMGITQFSGHGFTKSFVEHGFVIGIMNVRADLTYQEGLDRHWNRQSRYDFYWPVLSHLGEMAILNKEIYIDATTIGDSSCDDVFGYQEAWADLRYKQSRITGKFRSNDTASLDAWHLGIEFGSQPTLDETFITDDAPVDRVIATPTEPHFIFDSYAEYFCTRCMPTYSIPGMIDHF